MICPRCGVVNAPDRQSCTRCSGSLVPPPARDDRPLPPVVPVTERAKLKVGGPPNPKSTAPAAAASAPAPAALAPAAPPVPPGSPAPATSGDGSLRPAVPSSGVSAEPAAADLYLLSTDRSTGQPAPPDGPLNQSERLAADRPGRLAVGLSRA
jgi:hypothetical protein